MQRGRNNITWGERKNKVTYKKRRKKGGFPFNPSDEIYRCLDGFAEYVLADYPSC